MNEIASCPDSDARAGKKKEGKKGRKEIRKRENG